MKLKFFCPIWGLVPDYTDKISVPIEPVIEKIKLAGYDGVEMTIPSDIGQKNELQLLSSKYDLELIALQWVANGKDIHEYLRSYEAHIFSDAELQPNYINCHSGKDYFTFQENCLVINKAFELQESTGIQIIHEIHRGRFTFHSYGIQPYLTEFPDLKLTADFSHWCNVSESYLQDQQINVLNTIKHCEHIHARVGHPQGCQVNDPRAPEWEEALTHHLEWWDMIVKHKQKEQAQTLTITPEFGPGPYMPLMPYTKEPIASQWDINLWMRSVLKDRLSKEEGLSF